VAKTGASLVPYSPPGAHPLLASLSAPGTAKPGAPPRVTLQVNEPGVGTVYLVVRLIPRFTGAKMVFARMGWSHTGRRLTVRWPSGSRLAAGTYTLRVSGYDHRRAALVELAHISREASLLVAAPASSGGSLPTAPSAVSPEAGVPSPAQSAAEGAIFPVAGPHSFGGPENRFGAPRSGHIHEGQDVLTSEGTPVVAPYAGTIESTSFQAGGAGYYVVEHTGVGFDLMYAHCQASSFAVAPQQAVTAGQLLCRAGQTGDATGPHLHFEMWVGGWQAKTGHPIDPLPYLEAWEHETAAG
jgi:murein DD-endopeptidase MepM/ murein hydrolase activator NlpD